MRMILWILSALCLVSCASVEAEDRLMKPYPAADEGYIRHVIQLSQQPNERDLKVEIVPGKMLEVDCNNVRMGGRLTEKTAEGWGYPYYVLEDVRGTMQTKMACPPGQPKKMAFVQVFSEHNLQRYNSKLPLVVYLPAELELRYRIWQAGAEKADSSQR